MSYLRAKRVVDYENKVQFANPAVVEDSDSDVEMPRAIVTSYKKMSSGIQSTYKDTLVKCPRVSPPVNEKIMPTILQVIPYENHEVEQHVGAGAGTLLENDTIISDKERRLLSQKKAETKGNRLAKTTMDINDAHRLFGHKSGATLQKIANALDMKLTGKFKPCSSCMLVTARRSKVNRVSMVK